jgi:hypothetical protein
MESEKWVLVYYWNGKFEGEDVFYDKKRANIAYKEALEDCANSDENVSVKLIEDYDEEYYDETEESYDRADYYYQQYKEGD